MVISGSEIKVKLKNGDLVIKDNPNVDSSNINEDNIKVNSYKVHLGSVIWVFYEPEGLVGKELKPTDGMYLFKKGHCYTAKTREWFNFKHLTGVFKGTRNNKINFIFVECCDMLECGFKGEITFTIKCDFDTVIPVDKAIGHIEFHKVYGEIK